MDEAKDEIAAAVEPPSTSDQQSGQDLETLKWKARVYLMAGLIPSGVLWGFVIGKGQSEEILTNLAVGIASLGVALPLLMIAMIYAHRYSKATGKWWWV